ncbi:MAG: FAD-dependent thymidylate synthase [Candidatus Zixiibacteriota bacterium]|nr:MAG: FAD-dependent thymidylate synthase [candidate division Zixibacteria bacterium]
MVRAENKEANALLDKEFKILDHGFIRLVDYMGDDSAIVEAARVSYGKGTKKVSEDRGLIRYLMRHNHTSPFEMVEFKFHVKLPIFVARQWIRHRTANVNEYSGRYSVMKEEFYLPQLEDIRYQSTVNKQGRSSEEVPDEMKQRLLEILKRSQADAYSHYNQFVEDGLARELARINLPLSLYTEWYWKIDLHNLFHFLSLRMDSHAQQEIRVYAETMSGIVKTVCPVAYEAFVDYRIDAAYFSGPELAILRDRLTAKNISIDKMVEKGLSKHEATELSEKLDRIRKV